MSGRQSVATAFDTTLDGQDVTIEFNRVTSWSTDHHYGVDADGNRGVSRTEIDDDGAQEIFVIIMESGADGAREHTRAFTDLVPSHRAAVLGLIDGYLESHDPEAPDGDE